MSEVTCNICSSTDHYPVKCPNMPIQCRCGAKGHVSDLLTGNWRWPKQGEGSRYVCPKCPIKLIIYPKEVKTCDYWAQARSDERISQGKEANINSHKTGCYGEYAVVKAYDCEWTGKFYEGQSWENRSWDTERGEVRATFSNHHNGMKLYPSDSYLDAPYIWVKLLRRGSNVKAELVGWVWLREGRKDKWWNEEGYWIVPREKLRLMETLPCTP